MRKKLQLVATFGLLACSIQGYSQRFLNNVFTSVTTTPNVIYSNNISVLTGTPAATDLYMDVYQPTGDTLDARPLVLVLHTGSFLPAVFNGQPTGGKSDSAVVEMCINFAKKGYVAVAAGYRMGWNPIAPDQDTRTSTLLNAVYRSIQDAKSCVRYFKKDAATTNTYKIDTNRIAVGGLGSGGYIALAYGSLNKVSELQLGKFLNNSVTPPVPYVDQSLSGNFDGTNNTQLNIANNVGYGSEVQMVFNVGGAIGDSSWIEAGEPPVVSFHCTEDPNAPYKTGAVIVPSTGNFVVEASGSYDVVRIANQSSINNNAVFSTTATDVYTVAANANNDGYEGLYPFITPAPSGVANCTGPGTNPYTEEGAPWDWWDEAAYIAAPGHPQGAPGSVMACLAKTGNPDMSAAKGRAYIDTIQGYVAPRMACALGLIVGCGTTGISENNAATASLVNIFPNPATSEINFSSKSNTIQTVELVDITGRIVKQVVGLTTNNYAVQLDGLNSGLYFAKVTLNKGGVITKRIIVQ